MSKKQTASKAAKRSFYCTLCERSIRMPKDWTRGPAVRRHYWATHPEIMQPNKNKKTTR
jgi:hypothetical protein